MNNSPSNIFMMQKFIIIPWFFSVLFLTTAHARYHLKPELAPSPSSNSNSIHIKSTPIFNINLTSPQATPTLQNSNSNSTTSHTKPTCPNSNSASSHASPPLPNSDSTSAHAKPTPVSNSTSSSHPKPVTPPNSNSTTSPHAKPTLPPKSKPTPPPKSLHANPPLLNSDSTSAHAKPTPVSNSTSSSHPKQVTPPKSNSTSPHAKPTLPPKSKPTPPPKYLPTPKPVPSTKNATSSPYKFSNHFCLSRRLDVEKTFCLQVLRSSPTSTKANDNLALLTIVANSAIEFSNKNIALLKTLLTKKTTKPDLKTTITDCVSAYEGYLKQFETLVKESKIEAQLASYDSELATLEINRCVKALGKTENAEIEVGNKDALDYAKLAQNIADAIEN